MSNVRHGYGYPTWQTQRFTAVHQRADTDLDINGQAVYHYYYEMQQLSPF